MNSLSSFKDAIFPLKAFLQSVSDNTECPNSLQIIEKNKAYNVQLADKRCIIEVSKNAIKVTRLNQLSNTTDNIELTYPINTIEDAKQVTGLLSGICYEFGCKSYKEANDSVKVLFQLLVKLSF